MEKCVFCQRNKLDLIAENELALAFYDSYPVSEGHALVIPKRHVETFFDASPEELSAVTHLIFEVKKHLQENYQPDGYNIGVNVGSTAGQTVFHFHFHVIPRYKGDVADPRGGVRKVIPNRSTPVYCTKTELH
ncbi:MAG TPA: HIT family protein [Candidatus Limnocylindrales bacterium]|nr:HIT family protein [Candidatus Limnocylindrales bacterium]